MSRAIKTVARIALPIAGNFFAPGIGGIIGGALGGALGGGGIGGAILGAATAGLSSGLGGSLIGAPAGASLAQTTGNALLQGPTAGSGLLGVATGGNFGPIGNSLTQAATGGFSPGRLLGIGNQLFAQEQADTAEEAARIQSQALNRAIDANQQALAPYQTLGADSVARIQEIQADPVAYIQNNPLYQNLAQDAERRLLANQAARGKVGSGGTAAALQEQLLSIGNGLVNQELSRLQGQAGLGAGAAGDLGDRVDNLLALQGDVNAAGQVGRLGALARGYENQVNTFLQPINL